VQFVNFRTIGNQLQGNQLTGSVNTTRTNGKEVFELLRTTSAAIERSLGGIRFQRYCDTEIGE